MALIRPFRPSQQPTFELMWNLGVSPNPLALSDRDLRAIKRVVRDAREWAIETAGRGATTAYDAKLPDNAAEIVIGWMSAILCRVESQAFSAARKPANLSRAERRQMAKRLTEQRGALGDVREAIKAAYQSQSAVLRIKHQSKGLPRLNAEVVATERVLHDTEQYLSAALAELKRAMRTRGRPVDAWQRALVLNLGAMWYRQGWRPAGSFTTPDGRRKTPIGLAGRPEAAFPGVLRIVLMAQARRTGRRLAQSQLVALNVNAHLRRLREHHERGTLHIL